MNTILEEYFQIPPITRTYNTLCFLTTLAVQLDLVTPFQLYFNPTLVYKNYEIWRLVTSFCYFGQFGFNFFFNMIFTYRYCRMLEETSFRGRSADFFLMFLFGGTIILFVGGGHMIFLGHALTIMLVYVWSRRNPYVHMNFFGILNFQAPYLPWVLIAFSFLVGNSILIDAVGIAVGHIYYFLEDVFPNQPNGFKILKTPDFLKNLIDGPIDDPNYSPLPEVNLPDVIENM